MCFLSLKSLKFMCFIYARKCDISNRIWKSIVFSVIDNILLLLCLENIPNTLMKQTNQEDSNCWCNIHRWLMAFSHTKRKQSVSEYSCHQFCFPPAEASMSDHGDTFLVRSRINLVMWMMKSRDLRWLTRLPSIDPKRPKGKIDFMAGGSRPFTHWSFRAVKDVWWKNEDDTNKRTIKGPHASDLNVRSYAVLLRSLRSTSG